MKDYGRENERIWDLYSAVRHHACRLGGFRGVYALHDHIVAQVYHDGSDGGLRACLAVKMGRCRVVAGARQPSCLGDGVVRVLSLVVDMRASVRNGRVAHRVGGVDSVGFRGDDGMSDA